MDEYNVPARQILDHECLVPNDKVTEQASSRNGHGKAQILDLELGGQAGS